MRVSEVSCLYHICHAGMSSTRVIHVCHGDISLGFQVCHAGMSWVYVMSICHACTRGVMHTPSMSLYVSCRCVMLVCHGNISLGVSGMSYRYVMGICHESV